MMLDIHKAVREFVAKYPRGDSQWRADANELLSKSAAAQDLLDGRSLPEGLVFLARRVAMDVQNLDEGIGDFVPRLTRELSLASRTTEETVRRVRKAARGGVT